MKKKAFIRLNLDGKKSEFEKEVIYNDNAITYFDNDMKMIINLNINIHLNKEIVDLEIRINILEKKFNKDYLYIKYLLVDENITNEYEIKL